MKQSTSILCDHCSFTYPLRLLLFGRITDTVLDVGSPAPSHYVRDVHGPVAHPYHLVEYLAISGSNTDAHLFPGPCELARCAAYLHRISLITCSSYSDTNCRNNYTHRQHKLQRALQSTRCRLSHDAYISLDCISSSCLACKKSRHLVVTNCAHRSFTSSRHKLATKAPKVCSNTTTTSLSASPHDRHPQYHHPSTVRQPRPFPLLLFVTVKTVPFQARAGSWPPLGTRNTAPGTSPARLPPSLCP